MTRTFTIYSTPTCAPCKVAYKRLDAAGIPYEVVDLTEDAEALAELKHRLEVEKVNTPVIRLGSEHVQIDGLTRLMADYASQFEQEAAS